MARLSLLSVAALLLPSLAHAEDFYVDPSRGSPDGDGSFERPWRTLQEVVEAGLIETRHWADLPYDPGDALEPVNPGAPIGPGDTIWLADGYHGELVVRGANNEAPITIAAMAGHTPRLRRVSLVAAQRWILRGLSISPSYGDPYDRTTIVSIESHGYHGPSAEVVIENCTIFSVEDASAWTADDWVANACDGVTADGESIVVRGNTITNVRFGISMSGPNALVSRNSVRNFSGDGMRGLGDYGVFEYNYVANAYAVDDNHDDGFQSWSVGPGGVGTGEVRGVVLRGNVIVNYEDPAQPMRSTLQGIGCFDGFFVDWVVENNVVITDHWHGITLLGARDSRIVNNTVIDPNADRPGPPWISVGPHKDGRPSERVVVRNNLVTDLSLEGDGITEDHNLVVEDASAFFVAPDAPWDLHLLPDAPAVDTGSAELAPPVDLDGIPRPQGAAVDVGAYEWHEPGVLPIDAGAMPRADGGLVPDAGSIRDASARADGGAPPAPAGCGCRAPARSSARLSACLALALLAWHVRGRRRSRERAARAR
ncbi:MAG TPA: right-handed parallel beta-helix repeat-containing protein [Sandaracinaceae bacterium]